jgi:hypothetical protein
MTDVDTRPRGGLIAVYERFGIACFASLGGGLITLPVARIPFGSSPGRLHVQCPGCERWVRALHRPDPIIEPLPTLTAGLVLACAKCLGVRPLVQDLPPSGRVLRALERAELGYTRRPGEKRQRWLRRQAKAQAARARAQQLPDGSLGQLLHLLAKAPA